MKRSRLPKASRLYLLLSLCALLGGCGKDNAETNPTFEVDVDDEPEPRRDAGAADTSQEAEPECYPNPQTHHEIINACTDAVKISKSPELEGLLPNGSLPPLP